MQVELTNTITKKVSRFATEKDAADFVSMHKAQFHRTARKKNPVIKAPMFYIREISRGGVRQYKVINYFTGDQKTYDSSIKAAQDMQISSSNFRKQKHRNGASIRKPLYKIKLIHTPEQN